jgi:hypothetical protein
MLAWRAHSEWVEIESSAVKEDGGTEVVAVAEAPSGSLDPLDLGVEAFGDGVGDAAGKVRRMLSRRALSIRAYSWRFWNEVSSIPRKG